MAKTGQPTLYTCRELIVELNRTIVLPKFSRKLAASRLTPQQIAARYQALAQLVQITPISRPVSRDPDDDIVLACGIGACADAIISGDKDLLVLGNYQRIPILGISDALLLLAGKQQQP
jgi:putative PIN family toxin of toxin-antitoxin system